MGFRGVTVNLSSIFVAAALVLSGAGLPVLAQSNCGSLQNHYGPFDYRIERDKAFQVEKHHFNAGVESLQRGQSGANIAGDIEYLLRVFPNHHRGLNSLMRLGLKIRSEYLEGLAYSVECYFERALRFQPQDAIVRMLYANYLVVHKRPSEAMQQLEVAIGLAADNPFTHFNIGLIYMDLKDYPHALVQAHRAMELGFTKQDLKERLVVAGQWVEPKSPLSPTNAPAASAPVATSSQ